MIFQKNILIPIKKPQKVLKCLSYTTQIMLIF